MNPKQERAQVFVRLHKLRRQIKTLQASQAPRLDKKADLEAMRGEISVLEKELQSFEESGHTTFLQAKKMLEPKKGISGKRHRIKWKRSQIENSIKNLEERQNEADLEERDREKIKEKIENFRKELALLDEEKNALNEYNHTRFIQSRKDEAAETSRKQEVALEKVGAKIVEAKAGLEQACKSGDEALAEELQDDLHLLEMEKEAIENFAHEIFIKNLEKLKAKRRSELK